MAALGDFQIRVVRGGEVDARRWHQIEERCVRSRGSLADRGHHGVVLVRAGDRQHIGEGGADAFVLHAEAAGDDDAAVLRHGLTDSVQAFGFGAVEEPAGVDHHHIGAVIGGGDVVALGAQPGDDALAVHKRLGASQADEADLGGGAAVAARVARDCGALAAAAGAFAPLAADLVLGLLVLAMWAIGFGALGAGGHSLLINGRDQLGKARR